MTAATQLYQEFLSKILRLKMESDGLTTYMFCPESLRLAEDINQLSSNPAMIEHLIELLKEFKKAVEEILQPKTPPQSGEASSDLSKQPASPMSKLQPVLPSYTPKPKIIVQIPNAQSGSPYSQVVKIDSDSTCSWQVTDIKIPTTLAGLSFDAKTQTLSGNPESSGEFELNLSIKNNLDSFTHVTQYIFLVNADPRSLWKILEPVSDSLFFKPHSDQQHIVKQDFQMVAASRRGRSHEHGGTFRDDDYHMHYDDTSGFGIIVVADGAGSANFSRQGSKIAAEACERCLLDQVGGWEEIKKSIIKWSNADSENTRVINNHFYYFFQSVVKLAVENIENEAKRVEAKARDFATTLLVTVFYRFDNKLFVASFWVGDGAIAVYGPRGKVRIMGSPDGGEYAGQTQFLDSSILNSVDFGKRIRVGCFEDTSSLILMTDGVSDPYFDTDHHLQKSEIWDGLWDEIAPLCIRPKPEYALLDWLHFFVKGHHDDRTLAMLWHDIDSEKASFPVPADSVATMVDANPSIAYTSTSAHLPNTLATEDTPPDQLIQTNHNFVVEPVAPNRVEAMALTDTTTQTKAIADSVSPESEAGATV